MPYEVWTCDDFFVLVDDGNPDAVVKVAAKQMLYWIGKDGRSLPDALIAASCPQFAERLRAHISSDEVLRTLAQELA